MTTSSPPKTRASAHQAAVRQRIAQRDSPAGLAPPFETAPRMKWTSNPSKTAERAILVSMVEYLRDDPVANDDLPILRFICRDWHVLERTINTKTTTDTIKRQPMSLRIRNIHRTPDMNWHYWNDYIPMAIMEFYSMSEEQLDTPAEYPSAETTPSRPVAETSEAHDTTAVSPPRMESTQVYEPDQTDMTEHTSHERMPFVPPRHSTSPSGTAALSIDSRTTGSYSLTDTSMKDEVVYIRTQKPVQDSGTSDDKKGQNPSVLVKQSSILKPPEIHDDDEGFTPVSTRQNRKYRRAQTPTTPLLETQTPVPQLILHSRIPLLQSGRTLHRRKSNSLNVMRTIPTWTNPSIFRSKWTCSRKSYKNAF